MPGTNGPPVVDRRTQRSHGFDEYPYRFRLPKPMLLLGGRSTDA
jgi:hypothetical protein